MQCNSQPMGPLPAGQVDLKALLLDVRTVLRSHGLHDEADHITEVFQEQEAVTGKQQHGDDCNLVLRAEELKQRCETYTYCFDLLQRTCSSHVADGVASVQQKLWSRAMDVAREWSLLHEQQRQQLDNLGGRYTQLRQEHQVLRSNLRSLKLTVQQLLTDVSTLLKHTANSSTRQQQHQQQQQLGTQQHEHQHPSGPWSKQPELQQQLLRAGLTASAAHRGAHGGRRCASADGGVSSSSAAAAGAGCGRDCGNSSLVALTMQRLIASIEKMSQHFADCQAGVLIQHNNKSNYVSNVTNNSGTHGGPPAAVASVRNTADLSNSAARAHSISNGGSSSSINIKPGAQGHSVHAGLLVRPTPPSSRSSNGASRPGSSNSSITRPGPKPVLSGVAAAAAAIHHAMASAAAAGNRPSSTGGSGPFRRRLGQSSRPGQLLDQLQQQQQRGVARVSGGGVKPARESSPAAAAMRRDVYGDTDEVLMMRHSLDRQQAKAAADKWFAEAARRSASFGGTEAEAEGSSSGDDGGGPAHAAGALDGSGDGSNTDICDAAEQPTERDAGSSAGSAGGGRGRAGAGAGSNGAVGVTGRAPSHHSSQPVDAPQLRQQQQEQDVTAGGAVAAEGSSGPSHLGSSRCSVGIGTEASSSSSSSSLGPSVSERWPSGTGTHQHASGAAGSDGRNGVGGVGGRASCSSVSTDAAAPTTPSTTQHEAPHIPRGQVRTAPGSTTAAAAAAAAGHRRLLHSPSTTAATARAAAAAAPTSRLSSGVWGSSSPNRRAAPAALAHRAHTGPLAAGAQAASGPLTAALQASTAHRQAQSSRHTRSGTAAVGAPGSPTQHRRDQQQQQQQQGPLSREAPSWTAGSGSSSSTSHSSRPLSSCSAYSSSGRSSSCASTPPRAWSATTTAVAAGGSGSIGPCSSRVRRAVGAGSASSSSSLCSDGVLLGSFTTAASCSANNSPAGKSTTSMPNSPAQVTQAGGPPGSNSRSATAAAASTGISTATSQPLAAPLAVVAAQGAAARRGVRGEQEEAVRSGQQQLDQQRDNTPGSSNGTAAAPPRPKAVRALDWSLPGGSNVCGPPHTQQPVDKVEVVGADRTAAAAAQSRADASHKTPKCVTSTATAAMWGSAEQQASASAAVAGELSQQVHHRSATTAVEAAGALLHHGSPEEKELTQRSVNTTPSSTTSTVQQQPQQEPPSLLLQPHVKALLRQQLQLQPILPLLLGSRPHVGLLSPILEEGLCSTGSCTPTPRTSTTCGDNPDPVAAAAAPAAPVRGGAFSNCGGGGGGRGSSKLRSNSAAEGSVTNNPAATAAAGGPGCPKGCRVDDSDGSACTEKAARGVNQQLSNVNAASGATPAAADELPDAFKQGVKEDSPKDLRLLGTVSPLDTAVGRDTQHLTPLQAHKPGGSTDQQQQQQDARQLGPTTQHVMTTQQQQAQKEEEEIQKEQQQEAEEAPEVLCSTLHSMQKEQQLMSSPSVKRSSPTLGNFSKAAAAAAGTRASHPKPSTWQCSSTVDADSCPPATLLSAFPVDLGPISHSLDSLDALLMDASCRYSDEDLGVDNSPVAGSSDGLLDRQQLQGPLGQQGSAGPAAGVGVWGMESAAVSGAGGGCVLDLQDLLAIVLDVMNDKRAADKRLRASGLPQPTLGRHLQCYVATKVASNQAAYSSAMSAILTGLEQHKHIQPEIAVFCKVLSDELDEDYFKKHLKIRQHLQQLATNTALTQQQQQQPYRPWEECCSMPLSRPQLRAMLCGWAAGRQQVLHVAQQHAGPLEVQQLVASWEAGTIQEHCGSGPGQPVRAGSVVAALLLWELQQHLLHLRPVAEAFRAADVGCQGLLGLSQFRFFCSYLNPAMSDDEVQVLFDQELKGGWQEQVTFSSICRVLLPAM